MGEMFVHILWTDDICSSQLHMQEFSGKFVTTITIEKHTQKTEDSVRGVVVASGYMAARRRHLD